MNAIAIILIAIGATLFAVPLTVLITCGVHDAIYDISRDDFNPHPAIVALRRLMAIGAALLISGVVIFVAVFA